MWLWVKNHLWLGRNKKGISQTLPSLEAHTRNPKNSQEERRNGEREELCSESSLRDFHKLYEGSLLSTSSPASVPRNCLIKEPRDATEWMNEGLWPRKLPHHPFANQWSDCLLLPAQESPLLILSAETHWLKPPTLAKHHSNRLCELF